MDQIDFMQQVALKASELQASIPRSKTREWRLNYKMLFNPKLHCPFCEEWIESGRVWIVDEENFTVKRVWKLDGTKINVEGCHPHVGSGGVICMGSARSTSDALVAGIAGSSDFIRAWDWFPDELGHSCPNLERAAEVERFNRHADDPFEDDHDGESYCEACNDYFPEEDCSICDGNDRLYCESCWSSTHKVCDNCNSDIHLHADESSYEVEGMYWVRYVCEECYSDKYFTCAECDRGFKNEKHKEDDICVDCWANSHSDCDNCGQETLRDDLIESPDGQWLCEGCESDRKEKEEASDGE